ncbi:Aspartate aminotransferase, cytoplasmic, partial [Geodia barretti]
MSGGQAGNGYVGVVQDSKRVKLSSAFARVPPVPLPEAFLMKDLYLADENPNKINLGVGAYRTEEGKPWVLPVVRTVEAQMSADPTLNKEYLPLPGMPALIEGLTRLLLGESSLAITQNRV